MLAPLKLILLFTALLLAGCDSPTEVDYRPQFSDQPINSVPRYTFGVHPLHNPQRLYAVFNPLMRYLSEHIPNAQFQLEASRNYGAFEKKLYAGEYDFGLPNPLQTINAEENGYRIFAKMGDDENFRGIILVRRDSGIREPADLIGKSVSYPAATALAASMMPQYYLQTHGVNVMQELQNVYVGSQESSIMSAYLGNTAAGATWPPPWIALSKERPELVRELEVIWQTEPLPNNGLVVLPTVPQEVVSRVESLLLNLHTTEEGKEILLRMELSRFEAASSNTYRPVRDFVATFASTVHATK